MKRKSAIACALFFALTFVEDSVKAETVFSRSKLENISNPAGMNNPACNAITHTRNLGDKLKQEAGDFVGKSISQLPGLAGTDVFNTQRTNQSTCKDLCVIIPSGATFKARGSVSGTDASGAWEGDLSSGLPKEIEVAGWAAVNGPVVDSGPKGDVVCYTYKNWSHTTTRNVGLQVDY